KRTDYLFPGGSRSKSRPMSGRQLSRLLKFWVVEVELDPGDYSVESLRRTKALHILKGTGDLQTVRSLLGHVQIESTARYLGLKTKADPIAVCRAFDICRCRCPQVPDQLEADCPSCWSRKTCKPR